MVNRSRVLLMVVSAFTLSACAYLSGQNQSCPAVQEISDPSTVALPLTPKPPPKEEVDPGSVPAVATAEPAPEVQDAGSDAAPTMLAQKPDAGPPKPRPPVAAGGNEPACGDKANPCPMQKFMRGTMVTASTPEALAAAFTRVAGLSPSGGWAWRGIAQKGAELAKGGDVAAAKQQCKACHDQHREAYKAQYRARKF
jgi:hypothetical protein